MFSNCHCQLYLLFYSLSKHPLNSCREISQHESFYRTMIFKRLLVFTFETFLHFVTLFYYFLKRYFIKKITPAFSKPLWALYFNKPLFLCFVNGFCCKFVFRKSLCNKLVLFWAYKKTACQFQFKFTIDDYLQKYQTLQLFTNPFTSKFTSINVIKTHMYRHKVIKNAEPIKAWVEWKSTY
jgi:hypothetical protein